MISGMSGSHVYMPPTKKLREIESDRDGISNIPDGIIGHILSRLPTEEAVRTCVLSRDWKYKWTSIYDILIDNNSKSFYEESKGILSFPSFVDKVLELTHDSRIRSFRLLCFMIHDAHHLMTWISAILSRGIQILVINTYCKVQGTVVLPRCLASCTSLTELKLSFGCCSSFEIPVKNCFPNLKRLYLDGKGGAIQILNHQSPDTGQLLLNFPVLEILELKYCKFVNVKSVEIWAPELITFKANCLFKRNDHTIKIFGPKLAKFCSSHFLDNFVLDAPSLYYIDLFHHCAGIEARETLAVRAHSLLQGVPGLTCLKLRHTVFQAYVQWRRGLDLPTFDLLKRLEVTALGGSKPLLELLKAMPNLEYLNIILLHKYKYEQKESLLLRIMSRLKEVKFIGFHGESGEIDLIKLFLENAKKLERVVVILSRSPDMRDTEMSGQLSTSASKSAACVTISENGWGPDSFEQESSLEAETRSCNVH